MNGHRAGDSTQRSLKIAQAATRMRGDLLMGLLDAVLVAGAYVAVLLVRVEGDVGPWLDRLSLFLVTAVVVHLLANWAWSLYRQVWDHASVLDARRVLLAGATAWVVLAVLFAFGPRQVPYTVLFLGPVVATMLVGVLRFHSRLFAFHRGADRSETTPVVVIGADNAAAAIIRDMLERTPGQFTPVAILDDRPSWHGRQVSGIKIAGGVDALPQVMERSSRKPQLALLAVPSASSELVQRAYTAAEAAGIPLKVLPPVSEIVGGKVSVRDVRDLSIDDLLGRGQVDTDLESVRALLTGKRVLITGAGGSIGSEIARQVAACAPTQLILLDHDETHLYDAVGSIHSPGAAPGVITEVLADVRDAALVDHYVSRHRPHVVFHAAAHKHVPMLESHPCEAVTTNLLGTANVVEAAARHGVERLVFISTDKAVRPASVMGASKRLGEQLVLANAPAGARYCAVRFGNVLGSRGSVVPVFTRQIQAGGPVTVTDPNMTRFFMSIPEAVQLVLQAAALSAGSEVFMLNMGEPIRIYDLAQRMIRLSGRRVGTDIQIRITGARPGEKLAEELHAADETPYETAHPAIVALYPSQLDRDELRAGLQNLVELAQRRENGAVSAALHDLAARHGGVVRLPDTPPSFADTRS